MTLTMCTGATSQKKSNALQSGTLLCIRLELR